NQSLVEIRRNFDGFLKQDLRIVGLIELGCDERQQAQSIDVARVVTQDPAIKLFSLFDPPFLMVLGGERHEPSLRGALKTFFKGGVCLLTASQEGKGLAQVKPGTLERRVQSRGALEDWQRIIRP